MRICIDKLKAANPNVDPRLIEEIIEAVNKGDRLSGAGKRVMQAKYDASQTSMRSIEDAIRQQITTGKVLDLKLRAEAETYKGPGGTKKFFKDLFASSLELVESGSIAFSTFIDQYAGKYSHSLDMGLLAVSPDAIGRVKTMNALEASKVLGATRGRFSGDPVIDGIGSVFKTINDTLFTDKSRVGVMNTYRENYGFRRFYDGEKIRAGGLKKFGVDILNELDLEKSNIQGTNKQNVKQILDLINADGTEAQFLKLAETNELMGSIKSDMDHWVKMYDPYDTGNSSAVAGMTSSSRKERSYVFKSDLAEMNFLEGYGQFGTDIHAYVKADLRRSSTELGFAEILGPNIREGFDLLTKEMIAKETAGGATAAEARATADYANRMYAYASGSIARSPIDLKEAMGKGAKGVVSYGAGSLVNITNSGVLAMSAITQLADIPQSYYTYMFKNKESFITKLPKFFMHTMGASMDAMRADSSLRKYGAYVTDLSTKVLGDIEAANQRLSWSGRTLDFVLGSNMVNYMNRTSTILNIRLMNDLMKNPKNIRNADKFLQRWELTTKDLDFTSDILTSSSHMDLNRIPESMLEGNPRGLTGAQYKKAVADKYGMFMRENIRHGAAVKGFREQLDLALGSDFTNQMDISSSIARMVTQLKGVPMNIFNSHRYVANNVPAVKNVYANGVYMLGANAAIMTTSFVGLDYLRKMLQNDLDHDRAYEAMTKNGGMMQAVLRSYLRSNALSIFMEPFEASMYGEDPIDSFIGTPSVDIVNQTAHLFAKIGVQLPKMMNPNDNMDEVLNKRDLKKLYKAYANMIPFANARYYLPFIDANEEIDGEIVNFLDDLLD